jgi:DNA invertase Pin-like site-specific DNA recombinase
MAGKRRTGAAAGFVGYVRVSTEEQGDSGLGLAAQRAAIRDECARRGWHLASVLEDVGSGRSLERRPGLAAALAEVEARRAAGLVVAKLDRLSRSLLDFASLMERSRSEGWALVALDLGVDTSTPQGELMASVLATFSQFERRLIGQRTRDALAELKASGVTLGRPREIDDAAIDLAVALRGEGLTWRAVADRLNAEGVQAGRGGSWSGASAYRALRARGLAGC